MNNLANRQPTLGKKAPPLCLGIDLGLLDVQFGRITFSAKIKIKIIELIAVDIGWESV
jgi:hypothetical protein